MKAELIEFGILIVLIVLLALAINDGYRPWESEQAPITKGGEQ